MKWNVRNVVAGGWWSVGAKFLGVAGFAAAGLFIAGCADSQAVDVPETPVRLVETFTVERALEVREGEFVGRVRAPKEVELGFELAGRIVSIADSTGTFFKAGEELGRLDSRRYELALAEAEQRLVYAEKELGRMRALLAGGSSTQAEFDRVENATVLARIARERAQEDLDDSVLLAPFDGKLAAKHVEKGSFVGPGMPVLVFQEAGETEVDFFRTEVQLTRLLAGVESGDSAVRIADGALRGSGLSLKDYSTTPDPLSGAYRVTFVVESNRQVTMLPGAPVRLSVIERLGMLSDLPVEIPSDALVADPVGGFSVWLLAEGASEAVSRKVEVGQVAGLMVEIVGGLEVGDRVVTSGSTMLRNDTQVVALRDA
ncbi:efflux RND transporter periplasmic adaptor subunit [Pelagicoccus mobilis]|nr:efflux RND transporter periplasmic adaptor subunit [Pelagicoccus mobilis]